MIGGAANEAARMEALTRDLGERMLISAPVAESLPEALRAVGRYSLCGVAHAMELFALPADDSEKREADTQTHQQRCQDRAHDSIGQMIRHLRSEPDRG